MPVRLSLAKIGKYPHIRILRSFRNAQGQARTEMVFSYGRLDKALAEDSEILEKARAQVQEINASEDKNRFALRSAKAKAAVENAVQAVSGNADTSSAVGLNIGVALLWQMWNKLDLTLRFKYLQSKTKLTYDYASLAFASVAMRVLLPSSRLQNWKHRGAFIADFSELDNLQHYYRVLEQLQKDKEHIVAVINKAIAEKYQRAVTVCLYDVTTYAFESRIESEIRDFGMSKDHKVNEVQVVLGLVIDANGIPIDYELYRGDTNEFGTLCPTIKRITEKYKVQRIIVVADRGLNSGENLKQLQDIGCDFVIAQKVRSCDEETQQEILNDCWDETYMDFDEEGKTTGEIQFKAKTLEVKKPIREIKQSASGKNYPGKIIDWIDTRWIVTYSSKRAAKDNAELDRAIEKAQQCISQKNGKVSQKGWSSLIKRGASKGKAHLDQEKIAQKRQWAGYYAICTNMALKEKSSTEIVELYRQLWRIEDSFRITKTHLQARPVFVWNDKRIEGHFVVCYVALVLQRLMEYECHMKKTPMTTARILTALRTAMVVPHDIRHELFFTKFNVNEDFETLGRVFGLQTLSRYESKQALKKKLHLPRVTVQ